jgi:uncharacterized protein (TIGR03083 family)
MAEDTTRQPAGILNAIEVEARDLEDYLAGLSSGDLERPSACGGWTVADVVAHLAWAGAGYVEMAEGALRGDLRPPASRPSGRMTAADIAERARVARREIGAGLRAEFARANRAFAQTIARVGPADWQRPTAFGATIGWYVRHRVVELSLHGWDIRSVLEPPGHLSPSSLPPLMDFATETVERRLRRLSAPAGPLRIRFAWTDATLGARDLEIGDGEVHFAPSGAGPAELTVRCASEVFILLAVGRIDLDRATDEYGLEMAGDPGPIELLRSGFGPF